jgi:putative ABC transport system permease protein
VVTLVLGARARSIEFAVLRAVGSSRRQILRAMLLEWGVVLAIGGVIGILLGRRVATVMLSFLEVTEQGNVVIPPFIVLTDWRTLGIGVGALTLFVAITLAVTWVAAMRRASAATLRITQ